MEYQRQIAIVEPTQLADGAYTPAFVNMRSEMMAHILANLMQGEVVSALDPAIYTDLHRKITVLPPETLIGDEEQSRFNIKEETDILGGWARYGIMGTKAIMHPTINNVAMTPPGWYTSGAHEFSNKVKNNTLPGFSVFSTHDAVQAYFDLKAKYPEEDMRIKINAEAGGLGQEVIHSYEELEAFLSEMNTDKFKTQFENSGLILEVNLVDKDPRIITGSVGSLVMNGIELSYVGSQRIDPNAPKGKETYLGTDIIAVRGSMQNLSSLDDKYLSLDSEFNQKLKNMAGAAYEFDQQTRISFQDTLIASRRNYDVLWGKGKVQESTGEASEYFGVVDQSWRVGGATGAELVAACILESEPNAITVKASTYHIFDEQEIPEGAIVFVEKYEGDDGPKCIYTLLHEIQYADGTVWKREDVFKD